MINKIYSNKFFNLISTISKSPHCIYPTLILPSSCRRKITIFINKNLKKYNNIKFILLLILFFEILYSFSFMFKVKL